MGVARLRLGSPPDIEARITIYRDPEPPEEISDEQIECGKLTLFWDSEYTGDFMAIQVDDRTIYCWADDLKCAVEAIIARKSNK